MGQRSCQKSLQNKNKGPYFYYFCYLMQPKVFVSAGYLNSSENICWVKLHFWNPWGFYLQVALLRQEVLVHCRKFPLLLPGSFVHISHRLRTGINEEEDRNMSLKDSIKTKIYITKFDHIIQLKIDLKVANYRV